MGAVNTTYTFTATDTVTSGKLNNIIDQTIMTDDAVFTGGTVEVAGGKLRVRSGSITSNEVGSGSVTTNAIVDLSVTTSKIADSTSTTTGVTTAKIADLAITPAKLAANSVETEKIKDANVTASKLSGAQTGNAPIFGVRAWGSVTSTGSILASGNIASVTNTGTGLYTVTFTTAVATADYALSLTTERISTTSGVAYQAEFSNKSTTGFNVRTIERSGTGDRVIKSWGFDFMVIK